MATGTTRSLSLGGASVSPSPTTVAQLTYATLFPYVHIDDAATVARLAIEETIAGHDQFWTIAAGTIRGDTVRAGRWRMLSEGRPVVPP